LSGRSKREAWVKGIMDTTFNIASFRREAEGGERAKSVNIFKRTKREGESGRTAGLVLVFGKNEEIGEEEESPAEALRPILGHFHQLALLHQPSAGHHQLYTEFLRGQTQHATPPQKKCVESRAPWAL
jgi:hypothetical protein